MPSFVEAILQEMDGKLMAINTSVPGEVLKYDSQSGKAEVRPMIKLKFTDGTVLTPPNITNVPVILPRTGGGSLTLPIAAGDPVLIVFSQWSLDRWASEGRLLEAGDIRHHSMSDAFAVPGAYPFANGTTGETGTVLKNGNTKVKLAGEKVAIGNGVAELLEEVVAALTATATSNCVNGAPLTNATQIQAAADKIESIRGTL